MRWGGRYYFWVLLVWLHLVINWACTCMKSDWNWDGEDRCDLWSVYLMTTNKLSRENVTKDYPSLLGTSGKKEREREGRPDGQAALTNTTPVSLPTDATTCPELLIVLIHRVSKKTEFWQIEHQQILLVIGEKYMWYLWQIHMYSNVIHCQESSVPSVKLGPWGHTGSAKGHLRTRGRKKTNGFST